MEVRISVAEGGYIIQWVEPTAKGEASIYPQRPRFYRGQMKRAVRVKLGDALALAGQALMRLEEARDDDPSPGLEDFEIGPA